MSKKNKILLPGDSEASQLNLLPSSSSFSKYYPKVYRELDSFYEILYGLVDCTLGVDFEFDSDYKASIVGISTLHEAVAVEASPEIVKDLVRYARKANLTLVGHSVHGAEMKVIRETTGLTTEWFEWRDSMLSHFLLNQDLAKAPDKREDDDSGALGFMNLWTTTSMTLDVPNWKDCRGRSCEGEICPRHDVQGYCAIDAWASVAADHEHQKQFREWSIPSQIYSDLMEITDIAEKMHQQGIKVDMDWINQLETKADEKKELLFPRKGNEWELFNPRSNQQVKQWFHDKGVALESTDKKNIRVALEKEAKKYGYTLKDENGGFSTQVLEDADLTERQVLDVLFREYQFKDSGKGFGPWFDDKYRDSADFFHPRFITIGASTTRWSSSKPNFQNIPRGGFGSLVRAGIIPRDSSLHLLKADASNLEFRVCMYLAGFDVSQIPADAFQWLVDQSNGGFAKAAAIYKLSERDIAKSVSHAADYGEGFSLYSSDDLMKPYVKNAITGGSLRVYLKKYGAPFDWTFRGRVVGFTGSNLAERLFGSKSNENRKKALEIQEDIYFKQFPILRRWQKAALDEVESKGYVRYPTGHFLRIYGPDSDAKVALAALGQGTAAQHIQGVALRFSRELQRIPLLQVHDEYVFEIDRNWSDKQAYEFISIMGQETSKLADFQCPFKAYRGTKWLEWKDKKAETHIEGAMKEIKL